jgi:hypothetical protein
LIKYLKLIAGSLAAMDILSLVGFSSSRQAHIASWEMCSEQLHRISVRQIYMNYRIEDLQNLVMTGVVMTTK